MKQKLQLILQTLDREFDSTVDENKFAGCSDKDIFMSGAFVALSVVNGLDLASIEDNNNG